ncbi:MAG: helix-turn-helix domain-containing protein [Lewinellaceae bacterium]|nr:helix-turn-helix domain-containing protein [Saprospiraceae bacterium]MCB9337110.1 helix-turn-helix domain-containing protein [Lewinellaceae bacterium]
MGQKTQNERIIFGLKIKQLRQGRNLSFKDLSEQTGMSLSYLNEIEKGKKYPREDKLAAIAQALGVGEQELVSLDLGKNLMPVAELLSSNFLNELPLDLFDIELSKVVEIIANAPLKVGAFISTLVEISRNYALAEENFYFGALRSYLELNNNYFEEIEQSAAVFANKHNLPLNGLVPVRQLSMLLEKIYGYTIVENGLAHYPELAEIRSVFLPAHKKLLLNSRLTDMQQAFQFGKELGFNYLQLKERANTASLLRVKSFEEVLNHFKAGYFSAAILMNREAFVKDMESFFDRTHWDGEFLLGLLGKYQASPEMLFQRMTNVLPRFFGLENIFLLRFIQTPATGHFKIDKELHLNRRHQPHGNAIAEHYCRRWLSISLLEDLAHMQQSGKFTGGMAGAQRSIYHDSKDEYLCLTLARPSYPTPDKNVSITIGIQIDEKSGSTIRFLKDAAIGIRKVSTTCERCSISNCLERAAPPTIIEGKNKRRKTQQALLELMEKG